MLLHDSLADAVADVHADLPTLTSSSRTRGLAIRRRRRALATVGTAAAAAVLAVGGYALTPGEEPTARDTSVAADPVDVGALSGRTASITSRGVAAALGAQVDQIADGTFSRYQGDAGADEALAALLLRPRTGSGPAGQVFLNLQPLDDSVGAPPYRCGGSSMAHCSVRQLSDGDTLRTYREDDDTELGVGSRRPVAEVLSPRRGLRVVVFATNTNPWAHGAMRPAPVLTTAQLTEIATQPWWSTTTLPEEYVEAGKHLTGYADADQDES